MVCKCLTLYWSCLLFKKQINWPTRKIGSAFNGQKFSNRKLGFRGKNFGNFSGFYRLNMGKMPMFWEFCSRLTISIFIQTFFAVDVHYNNSCGSPYCGFLFKSFSCCPEPPPAVDKNECREGSYLAGQLSDLTGVGKRQSRDRIKFNFEMNSTRKIVFHVDNPGTESFGVTFQLFSHPPPQWNKLEHEFLLNLVTKLDYWLCAWQDRLLLVGNQKTFIQKISLKTRHESSFVY